MHSAHSALLHEHRLAAGQSRGQAGPRCHQEAQQPLCQAAHRCARCRPGVLPPPKDGA